MIVRMSPDVRAFKRSQAHISDLCLLIFLRLMKIALSWNFPSSIKAALSYRTPDSFLQCCAAIQRGGVIKTVATGAKPLGSEPSSAVYQLCDLGQVA